MLNLSPITNRQVWMALRDVVPGLPETTEYAVLRVDHHQAWLEWRETRQQDDGTYSLMHVHQWPTKHEADIFWEVLCKQLNVQPLLWQDVRIELRDLHEIHAVVIEGRLLWAIE